MNELLRSSLLAVMADYGRPEVLVIKANQPTKQGRVDDGVYYRIFNPNNHGWQARRYNYDHKEHQLVEATVQLTCFMSDGSSSELANFARMCVSSLPFGEKMKKGGVGVQRPTTIDDLPFVDEADNYDVESTFSFKVTYVTTVEPSTPMVDTLDPNIIRI